MCMANPKVTTEEITVKNTEKKIIKEIKMLHRRILI